MFFESCIMRSKYRILYLLLFILLIGCGRENETKDSLSQSTAHSVSVNTMTYQDKIADDVFKSNIYDKIAKIFRDHDLDSHDFNKENKVFYDMGFDVIKYKKLFLKIVRMFIYDNPKYSVYYCDISWEVLDHTQVCLLVNNQLTPVSDKEYQDLYNKIIDKNKNLTDPEIAYQLFMYLSKNICYDDQHENYSNSDKRIMCESIGCCQGISFAYKRLLRCAGIQSSVMTGYDQEDEYHMINAVELNNNIYFVDVTGSLSASFIQDKDLFFCMDKSVLDRVLKKYKMHCL